jgi:hypothetical protein
MHYQKARLYEVANELKAGSSPSGRGWREAPGEGYKFGQILRPSPCPLPEGEGAFFTTANSFTRSKAFAS